MRTDNLIYLLDTISSTEIDGDEFEALWEDDRGREGWTDETITAVAMQASVKLGEQEAQIALLRDLVLRMATILRLAGEPADAESTNPVRVWLSDADMAMKGGSSCLPSTEFFQAASELIGTHPYLYVELSRTRTTDWMAWLRTTSKESEGVLLASGQGMTPDDACRWALADLKKNKEGAV